MRLARFATNNHIEYGIVDGELVRPVRGDIFKKPVPDGRPISIEEIKFLVPAVPTKVIALGMNYRSHAEELKLQIPDEPLFFYKPLSALIGMGDSIQYPPQSNRVDYEAEMAFVIGRQAKNVPISEALDYVFGYTCFNDITARDIQFRKNAIEFVKSKGFDTFGSVGPWIETDVEPSDLNIECLVNGEIKQKGNTNDLIFGVAEIINFVSKIMTLYPGDIIATGTPSGIGPLSVGDTVVVNVEKIGTLENTVVRSVPQSYAMEAT
jgi:2-keto-4-pentenoate hydratase/2-oxohepta-3-ene-1,7-dioic acid hydratase in catechol pathway